MGAIETQAEEESPGERRRAASAERWGGWGKISQALDVGYDTLLRKPTMALFSPSESAYLTSFLSTVDLDSSISPDGSVDPGIADRVPHLQGSEALSKATKDLMALDVPLASSPPYHLAPSTAHTLPQQHTPGPSYWPSIPAPDSAASLSSATAQGVLKFGVRSSSPANYLPRGLSSSIASSDAARSVPHLDRSASASGTSSAYLTPSQPPPPQPHLQIAPLRGFDPQTAPSSFTLPPISTSGFPSRDASARPSAVPSPASAPSVLSGTPANASSSTAGSTAKRPRPTSSQPATDPSAAKRVRRSPSNTPVLPSSSSTAPDGPDSLKSRRQSKGNSSATAAADAPSAAPSTTAKGTLLSPSQKRANHIQSEQKRRANIRRGYEALCETVPALREAIKAEEERERAKEMEAYEEQSGKGKARAGVGAIAGVEKGKKKKGRGEGGEKPDGRAGPRSENVVLQKSACLVCFVGCVSLFCDARLCLPLNRLLFSPPSLHFLSSALTGVTDGLRVLAAIDYITDLLAERSSLKQRLELARGMLPLGHPALPVDPHHLDASGTPLWEREWNGGMDLDIGAGGGGGDEDGSEDEG
ncbi:hypothetical protein C8Q76DRAFT_91480 [Earliella scabrosa]|nr:hypothetical protein C8Q76DRAFT_91480 [Earliella scabrosa]